MKAICGILMISMLAITAFATKGFASSGPTNKDRPLVSAEQDQIFDPFEIILVGSDWTPHVGLIQHSQEMPTAAIIQNRTSAPEVATFQIAYPRQIQLPYLPGKQNDLSCYISRTIRPIKQCRW